MTHSDAFSDGALATADKSDFFDSELKQIDDTISGGSSSGSNWPTQHPARHMPSAHTTHPPARVGCVRSILPRPASAPVAAAATATTSVYRAECGNLSQDPWLQYGTDAPVSFNNSFNGATYVSRPDETGQVLSQVVLEPNASPYETVNGISAVVRNHQPTFVTMGAAHVGAGNLIPNTLQASTSSAQAGRKLIGVRKPSKNRTRKGNKSLPKAANKSNLLTMQVLPTIDLPPNTLVTLAPSMIRKPCAVHSQRSQVRTTMDPMKRGESVEKGLNVVENIVDIDGEHDNLFDQAQVMHDASTSGTERSSHFLDVGVLTRKFHQAMARIDFQDDVPSDVVQMVSIAARERIRYVLENARQMALSRSDATGCKFDAENSSGQDARAALAEMRDEEDRRLVLESEQISSKWRKPDVRSVPEAVKNSKDATAEARKKKKMKAALAKKRASDQDRRDALNRAVSGIKKRKKKVNIVPLVLKPSVPSTLDSSLEKQNLVGVQRSSIMVRDVLAFFRSEPNMCQGSLVYKWSSRPHVPNSQ